MHPEPVPPHATLRLQGLRLAAQLGWEARERETPQQVDIELTLQWRTLPPACATDELTDTVDYAALAERVREVCGRGEYRLLEGLAGAVFDRLRPMVPRDVALTIAVAKRPPPADVDGTASVTIGDGRFGAESDG